jgi:HAD superfamily hydrolase (TIGR01509 family)
MSVVPELTGLKNQFPGLKTILFDMDGTLFNTEKYHTQALQHIGFEQRITPPVDEKELHRMMMGKADHLLYDIIKEWVGFPSSWNVETFVAEKNRKLLDILKSINADAYFSLHLREFLRESSAEGIQLGLVTSSEKVVTLELLKMAKSEHFFSFILTRDDSLKVKPDPWPYLKAMEHFQSTPESTLIFEDSVVGLEAAKGTGAYMVKAEWY